MGTRCRLLVASGASIENGTALHHRSLDPRFRQVPRTAEAARDRGGGGCTFAAIRDQCEKHDVAFFFKQWGGRNKKAAGRELDGAFYDEFPKAKTRRPQKA